MAPSQQLNNTQPLNIRRMYKKTGPILFILYLIAIHSLTAQIAVTGYNHVALAVKNIEESARFYREVIGLEPVEVPEHLKAIRAWFKIAPGQELHLLAGRSFPVTNNDPNLAHFSLTIPNADPVETYLKTKGLPYLRQQRFDKAWQIYVSDPDGYFIELNEPKAPVKVLAAEQPMAGPPMKRLQVKGNQFVTENQDTLVFRGLNASDPDKLEREGHWNKNYFAEIKNWGANIVRFPVHPAAWRKRGAEAYIKLLDQGVTLAKEQGLYVIIDWHSIGNLRSQLFQDPGYETTVKETFEFWQTMSKHYKDEPTVAFFELYNEPTVYNGQLGTCTWQQWRELMEETITIIRAHGCTAIPLVAGFNWAYDLTPVATDPIRAEGIAYVSHPYPMKRAKPWEAQWTKDWGFVAEKYPLVLTEIGFCGADDEGAHIPVISDESYGDAITKYCAEKNISYVVWVFDPRWAPRLFTDWDFTPSRQGRYFKKALRE